MSEPNKMQQAQKLFELLEDTGELLAKCIHVIDLKDERQNCGAWRVYHSDGYCFDVTREQICEPDEVGQYSDYDVMPDGYTYIFYSDYDGFIPIDCEQSLALATKELCVPPPPTKQNP